MAFVSVSPVSGSVVATGDTITVTWDTAVYPTITYRPSSGTWEPVTSYSGATIVVGAGFTGEFANQGGGAWTTTFRRNAGWANSPFTIAIQDTVLSSETQVNYTLLAEGQYPPDMQPFNDPAEDQGGGSAIEVVDESTSLTAAVTKFTFTGDGVTATNPQDDDIVVDIPAGGSAITVTDSGGAPLTVDAASFDFAGDGVTATSSGDDVTVTIPGASGIAGWAGLGSWYYSTTTTEPPDLATLGSGNFRFNNANPSSATEMYIANTSNEPWLSSYGLQNADGWWLRLSNVDKSVTASVLCGAPVGGAGGGWLKIPVEAYNAPSFSGSDGATFYFTVQPSELTLDALIVKGTADNDVNVPLLDPVILRDGDEDFTPLKVVKLDALLTPAFIAEVPGTSNPAVSARSTGSPLIFANLSPSALSFEPNTGETSSIQGPGLAISANDSLAFYANNGGGGGDITFGVGGMADPDEIEFVQGITVGETADHPVAPVAGKGQFWVNAAGEPIFTSASDAAVNPGTDYDLTTATPLTLDEVVTTAPIDNVLNVPSGNPIIFTDGAVAGLTPLSINKLAASTIAPALELTHASAGVGITIADSATGSTLVISSQGATPVDDVNSTLTFGGGSVASVAAGDTYFTGRENAASAGDGGDTYIQGGEATHGTPGDGGDLLLDPGDGANVGNIKIGTVNAPTEIAFAQGFTVTEATGPPLGTTPTGTGQFWVNNATSPPKPYFTGDDDVDIDLTAGSGVGDVTSTSAIAANKLVIGDDGAKGVKQAPLGSLSDAGALTAIATIVTTSDITAGNDLISTADVTVGVDLNVPSGDIIMGVGQLVDGRDVNVDAAVWQGHLDTVTGNPHDVEGTEVLATGATDTYVLTANGAGAASWQPGGTGSGNVSAALNITDNTIVRGDGGLKGVQESGIAISDADSITGIVDLTLTGDITVGGTVDGIDIATDVAANTAHAGDTTTNPHNITFDNLGAGTLAQLNAAIGDATLADFTGGTTESRPAAGVADRYYYDTDEDILYRDNGTTWLAQNLLTGTAAARPATADAPLVTYLATDTGRFSYSSGSAWSDVGGGTLDDVLTGGTPDNDVTVPFGDPIIFRDGGNDITPFSLSKSLTSTTVPVLDVEADGTGDLIASFGQATTTAGWSFYHNAITPVPLTGQDYTFGGGTISGATPGGINFTGQGRSDAGAAGDLVLQGGAAGGASGDGGDVYVDGGNSTGGTDGVVYLGSQDTLTSLLQLGDTSNETRFVNGLTINETADHPVTPVATRGQVWVKNDATQALMFTDDAGTDVDLISSTGTGDLVRESSPTIVTPTVASFANATHDHADAAGGGTIAYADITGTPTVPRLTKSITVEDPHGDGAENISMFYTNVAITVTQITAVILGSTSVSFDIEHGTSRATATGTGVIGTDEVADSTTTGNITTSFADATIPADSFVWLSTSARSGTPTELHVTVEYTED